jgi:membrane protein YqaA with SNARE-associated domain
MDYISLGYIGIFLAAFIASTILPAPSEIIVLIAYQSGLEVVPVLIFATVGNVLGSLTNYYIGYFTSKLKFNTKLKMKPARITYWTIKSQKYGSWLGLLAWLPIIGDPLIILLGYLRVKIIPLTVMITIGKFGRYLAVTLIYFY